jgi:hypothetical protein
MISYENDLEELKKIKPPKTGEAILIADLQLYTHKFYKTYYSLKSAHVYNQITKEEYNGNIDKLLLDLEDCF